MALACLWSREASRHLSGRRGNRKHQGRSAFWIGCVAAAAATIGCSAQTVPSEETDFLEQQVVPSIVHWANGNSSSFSFSQLSRERDYDKICIVPQEWSLSSLELTNPVKSYQSSFGMKVPEDYSALVAISNLNAHAALINLDAVGTGVFPKRPCMRAAKAQLRRYLTRNHTIPQAVLVEGLD